jgi:hypothetical protein
MVISRRCERVPVAGLGGRKNYAKAIKAGDLDRLHMGGAGSARSRCVPGLHQQHQQRNLDIVEDDGARLS